jgi:hypothetical protein
VAHNLLLGSEQTQLHAKLIDWIKNDISSPFPGRTPTGPICPFTAHAVQVGRVFTAISNVDGSDPLAFREELNDTCSHFLEDVDLNGLNAALVIGFPKLQAPFANQIGILWDDVKTASIFADAIGSNLVPEPNFNPEAGWPLGLYIPMPVFVLRRLSPFDLTMCDRNGVLFARYRAYFKQQILDDALPTGPQAAYQGVCDHWKVEAKSFDGDASLRNSSNDWVDLYPSGNVTKP